MIGMVHGSLKSHFLLNSINIFFFVETLDFLKSLLYYYKKSPEWPEIQQNICYFVIFLFSTSRVPQAPRTPAIVTKVLGTDESVVIFFVFLSISHRNIGPLQEM